MQKSQGKFLVEWVDSLSRQQVFFLFWVAIGAFFLFIFWKQYFPKEERNFRTGGKPGVRKGTALVVSHKTESKAVEPRK